MQILTSFQAILLYLKFLKMVQLNVDQLIRTHIFFQSHDKNIIKWILSGLFPLEILLHYFLQG